MPASPRRRSTRWSRRSTSAPPTTWRTRARAGPDLERRDHERPRTAGRREALEARSARSDARSTSSGADPNLDEVAFDADAGLRRPFPQHGRARARDGDGTRRCAPTCATSNGACQIDDGSYGRSASGAATRSATSVSTRCRGPAVYRLQEAGRLRCRRGSSACLRLVCDSWGVGDAPGRRRLRRRRLRHPCAHRASGRGPARARTRGARARLPRRHRRDRAARRRRDRARTGHRGLRRQRHDHRPLGDDGDPARRRRSRCTRTGSRPRSSSRSRRRSAAGCSATSRPRARRSSPSSARAPGDRRADRVHERRLRVPDRHATSTSCPCDLLYEWCEIARRLLVGPHRVGRVIARPFDGQPGAFVRRPERRDYSVPPPGADGARPPHRRRPQPCSGSARSKTSSPHRGLTDARVLRLQRGRRRPDDPRASRRRPRPRLHEPRGLRLEVRAPQRPAWATPPRSRRSTDACPS